MLRSMTGFGASSSEARRGLSLRVEVRSVNHRHLVVKLRLPEAFAVFEPDVDAKVRERCERGVVNVSLSAERGEGFPVARVDAALARRYRAELQGLCAELELVPIISLETLIALPGVVAPAQVGVDVEDERVAVLALVDEALERMLAMRATEGAALAADLRKNAAAIEKLVAKVEKRVPRVVRGHKTALEKRVQELVGDKVPISQADLAREIALLADKLDVSEEIARLASHMSQLEGLLGKGGRIGRQLDFLVQEIFREVNTIGSKCADAEIAHWVVEIKTHVERLREQVQNVE